MRTFNSSFDTFINKKNTKTNISSYSVRQSIVASKTQINQEFYFNTSWSSVTERDLWMQ